MDQELVQYLDERFHGLVRGLDQRFEGIDQKFEGIDRKFEGIDRKLEGIDRRLEGIDRRFEGIDRRFDGMDRRFDGMDRRFDEADRKFDEVNDRIEEVKRHSGVLAEGLRHELQLVAEGLSMHIQVQHAQEREYFDRKFEETHALIHSSYDHLHQRVESLERNRPN